MSLRLMKISAFALAIAASWSALSAGPAAASPVDVTFKFDDMMGGSNPSSMNASSYTIQNYMTTALHTASARFTGKSITVSGALGEQGASSYTGDDHVVGPTETHNGQTKVYPLTLANTNGLTNPTDTTKWDGATNTWSNPPTLTDTNHDGYIKNCTPIDTTASGSHSATNCIGGASPDIFINFNGLKILSFSFDFEIFPDGTCPSLSNCAITTQNPKGNLPDLEIYSNDNGTGIGNVQFGSSIFGVVPGSITCAPGSGTTYTKSDGGVAGNSNSKTETAPQCLGHASFTVAAGTTITSLDFMDWPETIGIDNLYVKLPEPTSSAMFAFGLIGLVLIARRKRARLASLFAGAKHS